MKKVLSLLLLLFMAGLPANGQFIPKNNKDAQGFEAIAPENIYVHFNTTLLFPAEYLYYKVYCFDLNAKGLSEISKMAYVELIDEDHEVIFKHKVRLQNGAGQGDYFVPVSLPSGNYKLIAYTNWMKNFGKDYFFENDISIINPYQSDQKAVLARPVIQVDSLMDTLAVEKNKVLNISKAVYAKVGPIKAQLGKRKYPKRSEVTLALKTDKSIDLSSGNYSLSVRQIGNLQQHERIHSNVELFTPSKIDDLSIGQSELYLPELRGELISGRVVAISERTPIANQKVAISFPGEDYQFKIAQTNTQGIFYVNLDKTYSGEQAIVQVLGNDRFGLTVQLDEPSAPDYRHIQFNKIEIDQSDEQSISERSIHNQIESAYFRFKPDSILPTTNVLPFAEQNIRNYDMADYIAFKSVREALLEIIKDAWVRRNDENEEEIEVKSMDLTSNPDLLPLVIVDGIIVQDHERLLQYDARNLSTIKVYRDKYVFGPKVFQGAMVFETKKSDYAQYENEDNIKRFKMLKPQLRKNYFMQQYNGSSGISEFSLPDDRLQLLWMPDVKMNGSTINIEFFTSDVTGEFEICLEGFLDKGEPVSLRETFSVE